jgi:hypothetical protein
VEAFGEEGVDVWEVCFACGEEVEVPGCGHRCGRMVFSSEGLFWEGNLRGSGMACRVGSR